MIVPAPIEINQSIPIRDDRLTDPTEFGFSPISRV